MSSQDVTPQDALHIAQNALQKANEVDDLREEVQALRERVIELEIKQSEDDENREYQTLSLAEKVGRVRQHAFKKATNGHGRATLDYNDIMWEVFDGEPGTKHCYKLIRRAAGLDDDRTGSAFPGFTARDPDTGSYHLAVDADRAKGQMELFPENKTGPEAAD